MTIDIDESFAADSERSRIQIESHLTTQITYVIAVLILPDASNIQASMRSCQRNDIQI